MTGQMKGRRFGGEAGEAVQEPSTRDPGGFESDF